MKILITGGAGFVGSHVAEAYVRAGHHVVVVDNLSRGTPAHVPGGTQLHVVDITTPELDAVIGLERPDVVCHHAAQTSVTVSARDPVLDARINCCGLLNLLQSCVNHQVDRFIFASSGGAIYGDVEQLPTPEDVEPRPQSPYAIHKLVGERYLDFYRRQYGLRSTVLRYANVYGPRQDPYGEAGVVAIFADKLLKRELPTVYAFPDQPAGMSRDYVYVEDVAQANVRSVECSADGTFNIGTGVAVHTRELLDSITDAFRSCYPGFALSHDGASAVQPPRPGDLRESCLDVARAATILRWQPQVSLEDGLSRTISSIRADHTK